MSVLGWTDEETRDFVITINGRIAALEFLVAQLLANAFCTAADPVGAAETFRDEAAERVRKSTVREPASPEATNLMIGAMSRSVERVMADVVRRVREDAQGR